MRYIHVCKWEEFQARRDKDLPWIKVYVTNSSRDEWLDLSFADRGLLTSLWIEYARVNKGRVNPLRGLREDTSSLYRRLGQRVSSPQLIRLEQGDWIMFSASQSRTLVGLEVEVERELETPTPFLNGKNKKRIQKQVGTAKIMYHTWIEEMGPDLAEHTLREAFPDLADRVLKEPA